MKKVFILILLATIIAIAFADPGDVVISFIIPAAKLDDFRAGFFKANPIRGNYTEKEWVTKTAKNHIRNIYNQGIRQLALEAVVTDPNVLE